MKLSIALFGVLLLATLASAGNYPRRTPSLDEMAELGRKGIIETINQNHNPRNSATDIVLKKVRKVEYDEHNSYDKYTYTADFKSGLTNSVCQIIFTIMQREDGSLFFWSMRTEEWRCNILKSESDYLNWMPFKS